MAPHITINPAAGNIIPITNERPNDQTTLNHSCLIWSSLITGTALLIQSSRPMLTMMEMRMRTAIRPPSNKDWLRATLHHCISNRQRGEMSCGVSQRDSDRTPEELHKPDKVARKEFLPCTQDKGANNHVPKEKPVEL